jgi:hypothetical protein
MEAQGVIGAGVIKAGVGAGAEVTIVEVAAEVAVMIAGIGEGVAVRDN